LGLLREGKGAENPLKKIRSGMKVVLGGEGGPPREGMRGETSYRGVS